MKVYLIRTPHVSPATAYALDIILRHSGFFYEWRNESDDHSISIIYGPPDEMNRYSCPALFIPKLSIPEDFEKKPPEWEDIEIDGYVVPAIANLPCSNLELYPHQAVLPFDLPASVYFHLSRMDESDLRHPDELTDEKVRQHLLWRYGKFLIPAVDVLISRFTDLLRNLFLTQNTSVVRLASYPGGENFGAAITHDVDFVRAFHPVKKKLLKLLSAIELQDKSAASRLDELDQHYWGFDGIQEMYRHRKIPATFFFIPRNREGIHTRYDIRKPGFNLLFTELRQNGHEIGFHPSRFAFENPGRYRSELQRLNVLSGVNITGMRHHYLRSIFPPLWDKAAELGLRYDTTLGYRRISGFRAGTTRPFHIYDRRRQVQLDLIEFPMSFFENTLPAQGRDADAALLEISALMRATKKYGGLLTALWHTNNVLQPAHYQQIWARFLDLLQDEKPYLATLAGHASWQNQRHKIRLESMTQGHGQLKITVSFPADTEKFSLLIEPACRFVRSAEAAINVFQHDNLITLDNPQGLTSVSLELTA